MGFLRRLLGGDMQPDRSDAPDSGSADQGVDAEELAHELELLRGEQERLDDLAQRQLRWAKDAWRPPAQGGTRRADDHDRRG